SAGGCGHVGSGRVLLSEHAWTVEGGGDEKPKSGCVDLPARGMVYQSGDVRDEFFSTAEERSVSSVCPSCRGDGSVVEWRGVEANLHAEVVCVGDGVISKTGIKSFSASVQNIMGVHL